MKETKGFIAEFKAFIARGNVLDMAVGIIIGSAFTAIVTSLVNDIIMPIVGVIIGGIDFSGLKVTVGSSAINYGLFIQAIINFLLIALTVFIIIKALSSVLSWKICGTSKSCSNILVMASIYGNCFFSMP